MSNRGPSLLAVLAAAYIGTIVGFIIGAAVQGGVGFLQSADYWVHRYSALIAGTIAIFAALIAVRPVWRQLRVMSFQTTVALHDVLTARVSTMQDRSDEENKRMRRFAHKLNEDYISLSEAGKALSQWAWDMEQEVIDEIRYLARRLADNLDGDETTIARTFLLNVMRELRDCFSDMNDVVRLDYSETEMEVTDAMLKKAKEDGERAERELSGRIDAVTKAVRALRVGFDNDLSEVRSRLQLVNNSIIARQSFDE